VKAAPPEPEIALRVAKPSDALCIGILATQVFLDTYAMDGIRPSLAREVLHHLSTGAIAQSLADPATVFLLAERAGHLIGFAELKIGATHACAGPEATVELGRLYVQRAFAGKGVGTRLLARSEELAHARGAGSLWLTAWVGNRHARAFYARRGYVDAGATMYEFEGEAHENRVLVRKLDRDRVAQSADG
jgi:GNAT superfamily N-acetyltransferase